MWLATSVSVSGLGGVMGCSAGAALQATSAASASEPTRLFGFMGIPVAPLLRLRFDPAGARRFAGGSCGAVECNTGEPPPARRAELQPRGRSEEHTSELQSRSDLVCRLLLEKKKKKKKKGTAD